MRKILCLIILLGLLCACTQDQTKGEESIHADKSSTDSLEVNIDEKEEDKETLNLAQSKEAFILSTFKDYGLDLTLDQINIKNEGNNKTVAIYKDYSGSHKPVISKLIFNWQDINNFEIYHLTIENKVIKN